MPPSSRGPGRSPFKAKTGVRISVEALRNRHQGGFSFLYSDLRESPWRHSETAIKAVFHFFTRTCGNLRGGTPKPPPRRFFISLLGPAGISVEALRNRHQGGFSFLYSDLRESPWRHSETATKAVFLNYLFTRTFALYNINCVDHSLSKAISPYPAHGSSLSVLMFTGTSKKTFVFINS